jgi:methylmalonyl-CoA mutase, N-terminal domain
MSCLPSPGVDLPGFTKDRNLPPRANTLITRGIHPTMHRGRLWTMRMFAGFGTAEETNQRFKYLLDKGQTGLSIAFDLPTLMGYDTDAPKPWVSLANAAWRSPR